MKTIEQLSLEEAEAIWEAKEKKKRMAQEAHISTLIKSFSPEVLSVLIEALVNKEDIIFCQNGKKWLAEYVMTWDNYGIRKLAGTTVCEIPSHINIYEELWDVINELYEKNKSKEG